MKTFRYVVADVFTDTPLTGNQLAVFTDARALDDETMQALALEVGFSETVFVHAPENGGNVKIRIFTPTFELPFAGHPTLGTAFVLGAPLQLDVITLETGRGNVPVRLERDESGRIVFGRMEQPVPTIELHPDPQAVLDAVGVAASELPVELYDNGARHIFVALGSEDEVAALRPNGEAITALGVTGVSCFAGSGDRWTLRMFWERGEDAATGSAAGPLACHLARHGRIAWGDEIMISQGAFDRASLDALRAGRGRCGADRPRRGRAARPSPSPAASSGSNAAEQRAVKLEPHPSVTSGWRLEPQPGRSPAFLPPSASRLRGVPSCSSAASSSPAGGSCPSGETLSTTAGSTWASALAASASEIPSCPAIFVSSSLADHLAHVVAADRLVRTGAEPGARLLGEPVLLEAREHLLQAAAFEHLADHRQRGLRAAHPCRRPCRCRRRSARRGCCRARSLRLRRRARRAGHRVRRCHRCPLPS